MSRYEQPDHPQGAPFFLQRFSPPGLTIALYLALILLIIAFIPLHPTVDPLLPGFTPGRLYEFGLITLATTALFLIHVFSRRSPLRSEPAFLLVSSFTAWSLLSALWSPNIALTIGKSLELFSLALSATLATHIISRPSSTISLPRLLSLILLLTLATCLILNLSVWGTPLYVRDQLARPRLTFAHAHPLVVADILALAIIAILTTRLNIVARMLPAAALLWLLALTHSRGAALGLLSAVVAIILTTIRTSNTRLALLFGALGTFLVLLSLLFVLISMPAEANALAGHLEQSTPEDAKSLSGRLMLWSYAIDLIDARIVTGYGYYGTRYVLIEDFFWAGHTHNSWFEVLLGTGVVGMGLMTVFLGYIWQVMRRANDPLLTGVFVYVNVASMINPLVFVPGVPMFILLLSVMHTRYRLKAKAEGARLEGLGAVI